MEKTEQNPIVAPDRTEKDATPRDLTDLLPKEQSGVSAFLNGISNGLMIGGIPAVWNVFRADVLEKHVSTTARRFSYIVAGLGAVLGAWWGSREAKAVSTYRKAVVTELDRMQDEIDRLKNGHASTAKSWVEKTQPVENQEQVSRNV